ncbi:hypothetical protein I553_8004 [Mycobacterium xenopi 4042]|uniref:Uncharacterized protein n=1 Tax=Mycobacterium xenopi 4042 TaxID=1299334 RepID=X8DBY5_MYCXE|nr:hypothetical protein I553_8004 [Mycobacterium xenopi 4042]
MTSDGRGGARHRIGWVPGFPAKQNFPARFLCILSAHE